MSRSDTALTGLSTLATVVICLLIQQVTTEARTGCPIKCVGITCRQADTEENTCYQYSATTAHRLNSLTGSTDDTLEADGDVNFRAATCTRDCEPSEPVALSGVTASSCQSTSGTWIETNRFKCVPPP